MTDDFAARTSSEERLFAVPEAETRIYDHALSVVEQALDQVRTSLAEKRHERDEVLAPEIRALVREEQRLERMLRVGREREEPEK